MTAMSPSVKRIRRQLPGSRFSRIRNTRSDGTGSPRSFPPKASRKARLTGTLQRTGRSTGLPVSIEKFLEDIENWRLLLARNIALRNTGLSQEEVNNAVQLIIDRIIFLRICEDRGIEKYETLHALSHDEAIYSRLCDQFRIADDRVQFRALPFCGGGRDAMRCRNADAQLTIDDAVLKTIIKPALLSRRARTSSR